MCTLPLALEIYTLKILYTHHYLPKQTKLKKNMFPCSDCQVSH